MAQGEGSSGERVCVVCSTRYSSETKFCPKDGQVLRDDSIPEESLVGRLIDGRLLVERQLGIGGMGVVYLAQHMLMNRPCALKVLRKKYLTDANALGRFTRGAQNAGRIVHPNVATVFDFGEVQGEAMYLAMEYVDGPSLSAVIENEKFLPLADTIVIVTQVAEALKAAHALGIVHRDLKPENVMLLRTESGDIVKVVDFGISRAIVENAQRVSDSKSIVGTPAYMSPEQITSTEIDERSDLYSFALLTCEMLTGKLPLGTSESEVLMRFLERPRTLRELRPEITWPKRLQDVLDRSLSTQAADRQASVTDFAREFISACRDWRPDDVASAIATVTALNLSVSMALSDDTLSKITTPTPQPAYVPPDPSLVLPTRGSSSRRSKYVMAAGLVAIGALAFKGAPGLFDRSNGRMPETRSVDGAGGAPVSPPVTAESTSVDSGALAAAMQKQDSTPPDPRPAAPRANTQRNRPQPVVETAVPKTTEQKGADSATAAESDTNSVTTPPAAPPPNVPQDGAIQIGSQIGAMLIIGNDPQTVVTSLRVFSVPAGDRVRLRLRSDNCRDWDSLVTVRAGETLRLGYRNPVCPPR